MGQCRYRGAWKDTREECSDVGRWQDIESLRQFHCCLRREKEKRERKHAPRVLIYEEAQVTQLFQKFEPVTIVWTRHPSQLFAPSINRTLFRLKYT
jgi:hypothetical protein